MVLVGALVGERVAVLEPVVMLVGALLAAEQVALAVAKVA